MLLPLPLDDDNQIYIRTCFRIEYQRDRRDRILQHSSASFYIIPNHSISLRAELSIILYHSVSYTTTIVTRNKLFEIVSVLTITRNPTVIQRAGYRSFSKEENNRSVVDDLIVPRSLSARRSIAPSSYAARDLARSVKTHRSLSPAISLRYSSQACTSTSD